MENNKRPAQVERAIAYMREHGSISSYEAMMELGIMSFPKRVCEMHKQGVFTTFVWEDGIDRYGRKFRAKRYYLAEESV
jgi:hypothetical protein